MVIYLMRHTAVDVPQGVCYGQTDVPLKPTFETEATQTAANLQGLSFDKVYTSPLTRCVSERLQARTETKEVYNIYNYILPIN